jgi:5-methylcytosine-specific restriction endonuclease McrA
MIPRRTLSQSERKALIESQNNCCAMCGNILVPGHYAFDHITALEHDGGNELDNFRAICNSPCHKQKTLRDHQARAKRDRLSLGGKQRKGPPMAGSRDSTLKRCMDGRILRRP